LEGLAGVVIVWVSVLGWQQKLPRNGYAGVRTPATMRSDEAFRVANKVAAPLAVAGGVVMAAAGVVAAVIPLRYLGFPVFGGTLLAIALIVLGAMKGVRACK
jgi:uncharacterized membrane protein